MGLLVSVEQKLQTISHDISSHDLQEMVLEAVKNIRVKLKKLLGHIVQGDPTNLASHLHLEEKQEDQHARPDVEEEA